MKEKLLKYCEERLDIAMNAECHPERIRPEIVKKRKAINAIIEAVCNTPDITIKDAIDNLEKAAEIIRNAAMGQGL